MDTVMMLLIVLAAAGWSCARARPGGTALLLAAAAVIGLAFNVKLFEALLPLPALVLLYLLASNDPIRRRVTNLLASGLVFVAVSLSWVLAVTATPAKDRPFPLGSSNGTVWNAIFVFDGTDRAWHEQEHGHGGGRQLRRTQPAEREVERSLPDAPGRARRAVARPARGIRACPGPDLRRASRCVEPRRAQRSRERRALAIALAVWLALGCLMFMPVGRLQLRYLEALAPAIAAALGIGLAVIVDVIYSFSSCCCNRSGASSSG